MVNREFFAVGCELQFFAALGIDGIADNFAAALHRHACGHCQLDCVFNGVGCGGLCAVVAVIRARRAAVGQDERVIAGRRIHIRERIRDGTAVRAD